MHVRSLANFRGTRSQPIPISVEFRSKNRAQYSRLPPNCVQVPIAKLSLNEQGTHHQPLTSTAVAENYRTGAMPMSGYKSKKPFRATAISRKLEADPTCL